MFEVVKLSWMKIESPDSTFKEIPHKVPLLCLHVDLQIKPDPYTNLCSSSLNSTAVLFVFIGKIHPNGGQLITKVTMFNFQFKFWVDIPKMKEELQDVCWSCAMVTLFGKETRSRILVVFNGFGIYQYNSIFQKKY